MARLMERSAVQRMSGLMPDSATSPVICAMPIGPATWIEDAPAIQREISLRKSRSISPICVKLARNAASGPMERVSSGYAVTVRPSSASSSGGSSSATMPPRRSTRTGTGSPGDACTAAARVDSGLSLSSTRFSPIDRSRSPGSRPLCSAGVPEASDATVSRASVRKMPTAPCPSGGSTRTSGMRSATSRPRRSTVHAVSRAQAKVDGHEEVRRVGDAPAVRIADEVSPLRRPPALQASPARRLARRRQSPPRVAES